jgi:hypothetical protein
MPGLVRLVPGIHVFRWKGKDMDGRGEPAMTAGTSKRYLHAYFTPLAASILRITLQSFW